MKIEMWDKKGNSELVQHKQVEQRLIEGWSFNKPSVQPKPKRQPRKVVVDEVVELKPKTTDLLGPEDLNTTIEEN